MRKLFLILMAVVACAWSAVAQNRTISGTVVDAANNEPLIGATVLPNGGGQGTATDIDGNFTLSVPSNVKSAIGASSIGGDVGDTDASCHSLCVAGLVSHEPSEM